MKQRDNRNRRARSRRSSRFLFGTATTLLAASLLIAGVVLSAVGCGGDSAGEAEAAVQKFLTASENKDVDAVLGLIDPQVVASMEDELTGTGMTMEALKALLSEEFFPYDSVKFSNIQLETTDMGENEATVEIVGGTKTQTVDGETETQEVEDADAPLVFYLVKIDGEWYIDFESM